MDAGSDSEAAGLPGEARDHGHGDLAWLRVELDLLASTKPLPPSKRARLEELRRRERELLGEGATEV